MSFTVAPRPWDDPAGAALRETQKAELVARYGGDLEPGTTPSAEDIAVFLVATSFDGTPLGCGALRQLDEGSAEVKRMFVVPRSRGSGVAAAILAGLEAAARDRGWFVLRLETGYLQPDAIRFYEREGYSPIERYGPYVNSEISRCYERRFSGGAEMPM